VFDRVEERPNAYVLRRTADQHRRHHAGPNGLVEAGFQLLVGDRFTFEVLRHDVVISFRRGFDQLVAAVATSSARLPGTGTSTSLPPCIWYALLWIRST